MLFSEYALFCQKSKFSCKFLGKSYQGNFYPGQSDQKNSRICLTLNLLACADDSTDEQMKKDKKEQQQKTKKMWNFKLNKLYVLHGTFHVSHVMCQVLCVMVSVTSVTCHLRQQTQSHTLHPLTPQLGTVGWLAKIPNTQKYWNHKTPKTSKGIVIHTKKRNMRSHSS